LIGHVVRGKIAEIIFALPADVEGEATTNYIVDLLKSKPIALTRIARGIPAGGGLESANAPSSRVAKTASNLTKQR
jgi:recombination protein RecR